MRQRGPPPAPQDFSTRILQHLFCDILNELMSVEVEHSCGRGRSRDASNVASLPSSRCCLANSTMRMAFLLARPARTTKPICVKMVTSIRARPTPTMEQSRHIGTTRMTAREDQIENVQRSHRLESYPRCCTVLSDLLTSDLEDGTTSQDRVSVCLRHEIPPFQRRLIIVLPFV